MAFFIPYIVECDNCKKQIELRASGKLNMNMRLINPRQRWEDEMKLEPRWFASFENHLCPDCPHPFIQDEYGDPITRK
jgi:hypothetical protein